MTRALELRLWLQMLDQWLGLAPQNSSSIGILKHSAVADFHGAQQKAHSLLREDSLQGMSQTTLF